MPARVVANEMTGWGMTTVYPYGRAKVWLVRKRVPELLD
jgi:hypothetical protein